MVFLVMYYNKKVTFKRNTYDMIVQESFQVIFLILKSDFQTFAKHLIFVRKRFQTL